MFVKKSEDLRVREETLKMFKAGLIRNNAKSGGLSMCRNGGEVDLPRGCLPGGCSRPCLKVRSLP